jgi:Mg-chelatase subunit ChlD
MGMSTPLHVSVLIDRSGSMSPLRERVIEGVNGLFAEQRASAADAPLRVTLVLFDSRAPFDVVIDALPIAEVLDLEWDDFKPRGSTPLLDAIGRLIERLDGRADDEDQLVAIVTDGKENASSDYTSQSVRELIEARTEAGWTFLFLGANQDSFTTAGAMGMRRGNTRNFAASGSGTARAFGEVNSSVSAQRGRSRSERHELRHELLAERTAEDDVLD